MDLMVAMQTKPTKPQFAMIKPKPITVETKRELTITRIRTNKFNLKGKKLRKN